MAPTDEEATLKLELAATHEQGYSPIQTREVSFEGSTPRSYTRPLAAKILRICGLALVALGLIGVMGYFCIEDPADTYASFPRASVGDAVSLSSLPAAHPGCTDNGGVCICGSSGCQQWTFQVGDVMIFGYGPSGTSALAAINGIMKAFYHGAVHSAIVTAVNGPNLEDVIVTECLKGQKNRVMQYNMNEVLNFRQYHDVWIRRVDKGRYGNFASKSAAIATWANSLVNQPFDKFMIVPFFRMMFTEGRWFPYNPFCWDRKRALAMFQAGGPKKWICSQLVAWTLAFPGGLNTDYTDMEGCTTPVWTKMMETLQPAPGDLIKQPFWDSSNFHVVCKGGCSVGVLPVPR